MGGIKVEPAEVRRRQLESIEDLIRTAIRALNVARTEIDDVRKRDAAATAVAKGEKP